MHQHYLHNYCICLFYANLLEKFDIMLIFSLYKENGYQAQQDALNVKAFINLSHRFYVFEAIIDLKSTLSCPMSFPL